MKVRWSKNKTTEYFCIIMCDNSKKKITKKQYQHLKEQKMEVYFYLSEPLAKLYKKIHDKIKKRVGMLPTLE